MFGFGFPLKFVSYCFFLLRRGVFCVDESAVIVTFVQSPFRMCAECR